MVECQNANARPWALRLWLHGALVGSHVALPEQLRSDMREVPGAFVILKNESLLIKGQRCQKLPKCL